MIEVAVEFLNWEFRPIAQCTHDFFIVISLLMPTTIAVIYFLLGYFLKAVASEVKTRVAGITIQNLIRIIVKATEAYLTIGLKELFLA